jgi:hypothetical protein
MAYPWTIKERSDCIVQGDLSLHTKETERSEGSLSCMAYPLTKRERSDRIVEGFYLFLIIIGTK